MLQLLLLQPSSASQAVTSCGNRLFNHRATNHVLGSYCLLAISSL